MSTIRCPHCREHIDSVIYPAHEAQHLNQVGSQAVTTGSYPANPPEEAISLTPVGGKRLKDLTFSIGKEEPGEFVVTVVHSQSGRLFSPFIVQTKDEESARKLCQRRYLTLQSVERYVEQEGVAKPRTLPYGPPTSDRDFELDYGRRAADSPPEPGPAPYAFAALGWLLCGPFGALIGWWAGGSSEGHHRGE